MKWCVSLKEAMPVAWNVTWGEFQVALLKKSWSWISLVGSISGNRNYFVLRKPDEKIKKVPPIDLRPFPILFSRFEKNETVLLHPCVCWYWLPDGWIELSQAELFLKSSLCSPSLGVCWLKKKSLENSSKDYLSFWDLCFSDRHREHAGSGTKEIKLPHVESLIHTNTKDRASLFTQNPRGDLCFIFTEESKIRILALLSIQMIFTGNIGLWPKKGNISEVWRNKKTDFGLGLLVQCCD